MSCFLRLSNFVVSRGGGGDRERGGSVVGLVAGSWGLSGRFKQAIYRFVSNRIGRIRFHLMADKIFNSRFFFFNFFFFFFFQLQLCLSKRNIRSAKNTASRADGAALVGIERLTFRFGGSGMTIGPKSSFSSCSV